MFFYPHINGVQCHFFCRFDDNDLLQIATITGPTQSKVKLKVTLSSAIDSLTSDWRFTMGESETTLTEVIHDYEFYSWLIAKNMDSGK